MVARLSITPATIYQGFLSAAVGPRGSPRSGLSGLERAGPDDLAHLWPPSGAGAPSALGPHLLPGSPTPLVDLAHAAVWRRQTAWPAMVGLTPGPVRPAASWPGWSRRWWALPDTRSAAGRRTVAFPALALEGLATHLTGKGPDELLFRALKGGQLAQVLCAARRVRAAVRQIPRARQLPLISQHRLVRDRRLWAAYR